MGRKRPGPGHAPAPLRIWGALGRGEVPVICRLCVSRRNAAWPREVRGLCPCSPVLRPASLSGSGWVAGSHAARPREHRPRLALGAPSLALPSQPLKQGLGSSPISGFRWGGRAGTPVRGSPAILYLASADRLVCFD